MTLFLMQINTEAVFTVCPDADLTKLTSKYMLDLAHI